MRKQLFSGIQPTGHLHIGNYLGAIRNWVDLQENHENIFCIVDLHAITLFQEPAALREKIRQTACLLLAAGIDPARSTLFIQSRVSAHAELAWILSCQTPMGWLERMTQFKEKSSSQRSRAGSGLFSYPTLMAADILLYETDFVPVGEDQRQHVELTRDLAHRFNTLYGETFKLPEAVIPESGARIMGLDDPSKKMSKSGSEERKDHAVNLLDPPEAIRSKILSAKTDSRREIRFDPERAGLYNLLVIFQRFTGLSREAIENRFQDKGYAQLKKELAEAVIEGLRPLQERFRELSSNPGYVESMLSQGAARAADRANKVLLKVKDRMGLG